jgi:thimet oligopeptidase
MTIYRPVLFVVAAAALVSCSRPEPPSAVAPLPIRYAAINLEDMTTADSLTALCEAEAAALQEHFSALEAFTGTPTVDEFLESANSLSVSLDNMTSAAQSISQVHPDKAVRDAAEACDQSLSRIGTDISLSRPIYDATARIDLSDADDITRHATAKALLNFRLSGVDKDDATREKIRALNDELVTIGQEFGRNIRDDVRYLELEGVEQLAGLPEDYIEAHQPDENGVIRISTQYPDYYPFMSYAESDELRRQLMTTYLNRGYPQNKEVLHTLLAKRFELANLIGYDNYAQLITANKMTGSPETVEKFLDELRGFTAESQEREYQVLLERLRRDQPDAERVERWQAGFISEKVRREQYDVDSKEVRQYFSYNNTRGGIFDMVQDLFQVRIEPWETETWHEDVEAYELYDGDEVIGRFYLDMHPREGKYQHAAMFPFVNGIKGRQLPVAGLICNFPEGDDSMQHAQVQTFLHEFGHLMHWLFAGHHRWGNVSGITTEWDFVEAPSQMLQEWVWDYDTVSAFAKNSAGEALPEDLLDRMIAARDFGLGMFTRRQLSYAAISMGLYNRDPAGLDLDQFNQDITREFTLFEPVENTHFYAAFGHLNGYSAIYYTYQWSLAIATDMFTRFKESGLRNVEVAGSYRDKVLGAGGSRPASDLVTDFLGREVSFKPYADRLNGSASGGSD